VQGSADFNTFFFLCVECCQQNSPLLYRFKIFSLALQLLTVGYIHDNPRKILSLVRYFDWLTLGSNIFDLPFFIYNAKFKIDFFAASDSIHKSLTNILLIIGVNKTKKLLKRTVEFRRSNLHNL